MTELGILIIGHKVRDSRPQPTGCGPNLRALVTSNARRK